MIAVAVASDSLMANLEANKATLSKLADPRLINMDDAEADVFCPHWGSIEPETAAELHAAGKLIGVWTVDDVFSLTWAKALPANAIYTNKPREIRP